MVPYNPLYDTEKKKEPKGKRKRKEKTPIIETINLIG
jgi:hypothetical protein